MLDLSFQGVKRLLVLFYDSAAADHQVSVIFFKKYFLPRIKIENYNIETDQLKKVTILEITQNVHGKKNQSRKDLCLPNEF